VGILAFLIFKVKMFTFSSQNL